MISSIKFPYKLFLLGKTIYHKCPLQFSHSQISQLFDEHLLNACNINYVMAYYIRYMKMYNISTAWKGLPYQVYYKIYHTKIHEKAYHTRYITRSTIPKCMKRSTMTGILHYAMVVCRSHDTARSLAHGVFISRPTSKSRPTGKIQTH